MLSSPYTPLKTKTQIITYIWKFECITTKKIFTSTSVSEKKARNNICFKEYGTQKLDRDVFNSQLKLVFCSNPHHNPQYIKKIREAEEKARIDEIEKDIWETCIENGWALNTHLKSQKIHTSQKSQKSQKPQEKTPNTSKGTQTNIWEFI